MKTKKRPSAFDPNYSPYGTYEGKRGNPDQWADSFKSRFSDAEIKEIIGEESPWKILGLTPGATQKEIRSAFLRLALETHPDRNPHLDGSEFRKVRAAYEKLT